jgi:hypothetical protein
MNGDSTPDQLPNHITEVSSYWQPNKGLNILTGVNGSGKTRLLDYIYSYMNDEVTINFQALGTSNVNKLDIKFKNPFIPIPDTFVIISNPIRMY